MTIVYIAPLPPPINRHSLVSKSLYEELRSHHQVEAVNLSKNSFVEGVDGLKRVIEVRKGSDGVVAKGKKPLCIPKGS